MWFWLRHYSHLLLLLHIRPSTCRWILWFQLWYHHFFVFLGVCYFCSEDSTTTCFVLFEASLKEVGMLLLVNRLPSAVSVCATFWLREHLCRGWWVHHVLVLIHHDLLLVFFNWTQLSHLREPLLLILLLFLELPRNHLPLGLLLLGLVIRLLLLQSLLSQLLTAFLLLPLHYPVLQLVRLTLQVYM